MRFLVDAQLPPALARQLASQGHDAQHVADIGLLDAPDSDIWETAKSSKATINTKDEDFAQRRNLHNEPYPTIVWIRTGNTRKNTLLNWFGHLLPRIIEALQHGETLIEID
ncbi:MAG: DUF5615 family PIN-like protein [Gammaproteobacteria bacterium]|nr:DUF5615 family PIN-like protein [Gammaproteobacteria bacterium]